jgi:hypothetical protein
MTWNIEKNTEKREKEKCTPKDLYYGKKTEKRVK